MFSLGDRLHKDNTAPPFREKEPTPSNWRALSTESTKKKKKKKPLKGELGITKDKKIAFFCRFFDEKLVFGWVGIDFGKQKSEVKKSEKNSRKIGFQLGWKRFWEGKIGSKKIREKSPIFP